MHVGFVGVGWGVEPAFYIGQKMIRLVRENFIESSVKGVVPTLWTGMRVGSLVSVRTISPERGGIQLAIHSSDFSKKHIRSLLLY